MVIFLSALCLGTFSTISLGENVTISFSNTGKWFANEFDWNVWGIGWRDFAINLALMFPVGTFCVMFFEKHPLVCAFAIALCLSALVEFLQFALPIARNPQLSDIIFNALSAYLGALYALGLLKLKARKKSQKSLQK